MRNMSLETLRKQLAKLVDRVRYKDERFLVTKREKDAVAIVSVADLALLERLEDTLYVREAERILADPELSKRTPLDLIEKELGL